MKQLWQKLGIVAFWLVWPGLWLYIHGTVRTRLLLIADGKVLVVRGWLSSGRWGLPGGGLHRDEDPVLGMLRELREETGLMLQPADISPLADEPCRINAIEFQCRYFVARLDHIPQTTPQKYEITACDWLSPSDLHSGNATSEVLAALQHLARLDNK